MHHRQARLLRPRRGYNRSDPVPRWYLGHGWGNGLHVVFSRCVSSCAFPVGDSLTGPICKEEPGCYRYALAWQ